MIRLTPISVEATAQQYVVEVSEKLCKPYCINGELLPQGTLTFSVGRTQLVDGIAYVEIIVNGNVVYHPKDGGCNSVVKQFNESVWVGFVGTSVPTVAITTTTPLQVASDICCNTACGWSMVQSITITPTF